MTTALVIQCFNKPDTLANLCRSLLACEGRQSVHLIFWRDVPKDPDPNARVCVLNREVAEQVAAFQVAHAADFASIEILANDTNRGTAPTCKAALDYAFGKHEFVIFTEDDTIFARDALRWFAAMRAIGVLDQPQFIALAGESIYFDSRRAPLPPGYAEQARAAATRRGLQNFFVHHNFLPSTCFATTRANWARFAELRGRPRGPEAVIAWCQENKLDAVFPVVPRVYDTGMLHQDGYSVRTLGAERVREIKNTYLTTDDLPPFTAPPAPFTGSMGRLFEESAKLLGFDPN